MRGKSYRLAIFGIIISFSSLLGPLPSSASIHPVETEVVAALRALLPAIVTLPQHVAVDTYLSQIEAESGVWCPQLQVEIRAHPNDHALLGHPRFRHSLRTLVRPIVHRHLSPEWLNPVKCRGEELIVDRVMETGLDVVQPYEPDERPVEAILSELLETIVHPILQYPDEFSLDVERIEEELDEERRCFTLKANFESHELDRAVVSEKQYLRALRWVFHAAYLEQRRRKGLDETCVVFVLEISP